MDTHFILALLSILIITIARSISVVLMNLANKEKPMNKVFRSALMIASCFCETVWAVIVSVFAGAVAVHAEFSSVLDKHICI